MIEKRRAANSPLIQDTTYFLSYKYNNMDRVKVNVGDKTYNCQVAKTEEDRKKGLMGVENLP